MKSGRNMKINRINLNTKAREEALLYLLNKDRALKKSYFKPSEYLEAGFDQLHIRYFTGCVRCGDKAFAWLKYDLKKKIKIF